MLTLSLSLETLISRVIPNAGNHNSLFASIIFYLFQIAQFTFIILKLYRMEYR